MNTTPVPTATAKVLSNLRAMLIQEAEKANAAYPQYAGHWDGWRVAEITRTVRTKLGVAFEPGDLVLVSPEVTQEVFMSEPYTTAYSRRNRINTAVPTRKVREVVVVDEAPVTAPKIGHRYACLSIVSDSVHRRPFHSKGSGKPRRKRCGYCHGELLVESGWFGVFVWSGGLGRYDRADALRLFASESAAQKYADARAEDNVVVRWVYA